MNKYYYELIVTVKENYELYLELINNLTFDAVEEYNNQIIIRSENSMSDIKDGILLFASKLNGKKDIVNIELVKKDNIDWIKRYQESVQPIEVDEFYIHPSWDNPKNSKINIKIDPALTFGSGHHETTKSCLKCISLFVSKNDEVLDVGCGSGILSIACAKKGAIVDVCDTDKVAVEDTLDNFQKNGVSVNCSWEGSANGVSKQYDVVIANIVADVLIMIHKDLKKATKSGGILILSGILNKYASKVLEKFSSLEVVETITINEWTTFVFKNI